jgi:hypothetical protein
MNERANVVERGIAGLRLFTGEPKPGDPAGGSARRSGTSLAIAAYATALAFTTFQLPFHFPPGKLVRSSSYVFGFNNALAIVSLAVLLAVAALYCLVRRTAACEPRLSFPERPAEGLRPLSPWLFVAMAGVYAALTLLLYEYMQRASGASLVWEARHFLHRVKLHEIYGLAPYVDFQAEYGPLLMYPPIWAHALLGPLGVSREAAYFVSHLLLNLAGLWCLFHLLSRVSAPTRPRTIAFVILAVAGFGPYMGLNGVLLRYTAPFIAVFVAHRLLAQAAGAWSSRRWLASALLLFGLAALNLLLSPEVIAAFVLGWGAYVVLAIRADRGRWRLVPTSLVAFGGAAAAARIFLPAEYYGSLLRFAEGANNLPILPAAHVLVYLVTLVLVVPPLLAAGLRGRTSDAPLLGALGALCVVMMPGALGRCDPPHVMFYGLVASLLLMARLANVRRAAFVGFSAAYAAVFIGAMGIVLLDAFFGVKPKSLILHPVRAASTVVANVRADLTPRDRSYLAQLDGYSRIGVPFATYGGDHAAEAYLFEVGRLAPEYYVASVGVYTGEALERKLQDVGRHEYLLVRQELMNTDAEPSSLEARCASARRSLTRWFLFPTGHLVCRRQDLQPDAEVARFILANYRPVEQVRRSLVVQRIGTAGQ